VAKIFLEGINDMQKIILFLITLFISLPTTARPADPANISASNIALFKQINHLCDKPSFPASQACAEKLQARYEQEGKFRGTARYAAVHYKNLTHEQLLSALKELSALRKKARDLSDALMDPVEGELTEDKYTAEMDWVAAELNGRGHKVPRSLVNK
jgi:hypothetical protein